MMEKKKACQVAGVNWAQNRQLLLSFIILHPWQWLRVRHRGLGLTRHVGSVFKQPWHVQVERKGYPAQCGPGTGGPGKRVRGTKGVQRKLPRLALT